MTDLDRLEQRLAAVERVVVDGDASVDELATRQALSEAIADLEDRLEEHERRLADLEAAVQSVQGYVGNVETVNDAVERRAAAAVATADRLERRVEALEVELDDRRGGILEDGEEDDPRDEREHDDEGSAGDTTEPDAVCALEREPIVDREPVPEQSAREIVGDDAVPGPVVDGDGSGESPPNADRSTPESTFAADDESTADDRSAVDDGARVGLLGSLRARLP